MTGSVHFPHAMTLRISRQMDDELESLAYDLRISKAGTIRRILARAIAETQQGDVRILNVGSRGGLA